jgi:adenylate cyclase
MPSQSIERKLTAILSADVKGYSRLMGEDEESTVRTLNAYRKIMVALVGRHRGRVVDATGDNVLAEFSSVVNAVQCAVEIQKELGVQNAELPENRKMEFRIGVNLGDVIEEGETIYGDGVNIAARLESLAEGGGICISGSAFEQVENKLVLGYEYLGEQTVKNIKKPVRVYRVMIEPEAARTLRLRALSCDDRARSRRVLAVQKEEGRSRTQAKCHSHSGSGSRYYSRSVRNLELLLSPRAAAKACRIKGGPGT